MGTGRTPQQPTLPPRYDAPSYNAVYHGRVDTYRQSPVDVYLLKEEYSGSAAELRLAQEPVEEQASESGAEEMAPLRPRKGTVRLHASEKDVIRDVYSDETPWRVRIEIGGVVDVLGPVRKRLRTTSDDMLSSEPLELKWNDGLGSLQNVSFTEESGSAYSDRRSIIGWIIQMLAATGLDLDVAAATEWYTPGMSGSACPLEQEYVDGARFVDSGGAPLTCYEVLEDLVREKGAFLCQERGRWHIYQRSLFRKSTFDRWIYPDGWTEQSSSPSAESYDAQIGASSSFDARLKGSESSARPAYSGVAVTYEHRAIDNALRPWGRKYRGYSSAGDYTTERELFWTVDDWGWTYGDRAWGPTFPPNESSFSVDDGPFSGWVRAPVRDYDDSKTVGEALSKSALAPAALFESQRVKLAVPVYVDEGAYDCLSYAKLVLDGDDGTTYYLRRQVQADGDSYTYGDPTWTTDALAFVAFIVEPGREQDVSVTAPSLPADGALQVEMYGLIDPSPETAGSPSYKMALPALSPTAGGGQATSTTREALATDRTASDIYDVTVLHGTGPTGAHAAATREGSSDTAPLADDWKVGVYTDEEPTGLSAAALWAREALYQLSATRDVLRWTLVDERPSLTRAARLPSGAVYLPLHTKTRYKEDHQTVEAVRLRRDTTVSYSLVERTDESGAGGGAGSSGATSGSGGTGVSGGGTWPVSGTPDDIFSRSGQGGTVTLGQSDIASALGHSGLSEGIQTSVREQGAASNEALVTEKAVQSELAGQQSAQELIAQELVQTQAEIDALDAVTLRKARELKGGQNIQQMGPLGDGQTVATVGRPTFDQVELSEQADGAGEAVRADRKLTTGGNVKGIGDLTQDREVALVDQPTFKQVGLNQQADSISEAVRADRTVEVEGSANQIGVKATETTQGNLTSDVSVKLQTPQNIHEGADFRVDQLRVGTDDSPGTTGGAHFGATIQHPQWSKGLEHWGMTPNGELDARLIEVDELIAKAFTADITQSLAGSDVLTLSAADLASDFSVPAPSGGYVTDALHIENVGEAGAQAAFRDGDTVRLRIIDRSGGGLKVLDVWGTVKNYTDQGNGTQKWDFETASGTNSSAYGSTINKGSRVLDYGKSGDTIIQRTVLGSLSPHDRAVQWYDDDNDGVPDSYDILTQTGNIAGVGDVDSGLSKPGYYGSVARFTDDVVVGDLNAARSNSSGSYLKFTESEGLEIVVSSGDVETQITSNASDISTNASDIGDNASDIGDNSSRITDNEADLRLLAQRVTQEQEARAGISLDVGENSAEIAIQAEILSDNGITANTNITSRVSTAEDDIGINASDISANATDIADNVDAINLNADDIDSNTTAINSLEAQVGDGSISAGADLTQAANVNTGDISDNEGNISQNATAITDLENYVGIDEDLAAESNLTLLANANKSDTDQNASDISANATDIADNSDAINLNADDIDSNATAITDIENHVGIDEDLAAEANLTLLANANKSDTDENASAVTQLENRVGVGETLEVESNLTLAANQNAADIKLVARRVVQQQEATAGIQANVNENSATLLAEVTFEPAGSAKDSNRAAMKLVADDDGSSAALIGDSIELTGDTFVDGTFTVDDGTAGGWAVTQDDIRSKPNAGSEGVLLSTNLGSGRFQESITSIRATSDVTDSTARPFVELFVNSDSQYGIYAEGVDGNGDPKPLFGLGKSPAGVRRSEDFFLDGSLVIDGTITVDEIKADSFLADEILANEATVSDVLTMGSGGKITDDASTANYKVTSDGLDLRAGTSTRTPAREITWREPDLTGTIRGEIYAHNYSLNLSSFRFGSANSVSTNLTAYDRPKSQDNKKFARIRLRAEQYDNNEINVILNGKGDKFNIGDGDPVFTFEPKEWAMAFTEVYDFGSVPGGSPSTPTDGLRLYAKDQFTGNDVPYLWFITEDGTQYRIDATPIT